MVVLSHSFALVGLPEPQVFHRTLGAAGLNIFFVTSGYLIYQSWQRDPNPLRFLMRRCLRIFPALAMIVVLAVFVVGPIFSRLSLTGYFSTPQTYAYLQNAVFIGSRGLPGAFENNPYPLTVNGGLWTLKYEFVLYLCVLALGVVSKNRPTLLPLGLSASVCFLCVVALGLELTPLPAASSGDSLGFITGIRAKLSDTALRFPELALLFIGGALLSYWRQSIQYRWDIFAALTIAALAAWFALHLHVISLLLIWALFIYGSLIVGNAAMEPLTRFGKYGDFSYGIYIYGFIVQQCVSSVLRPHPSWGVALACSFALTLILAFLSWTFIEAPAMRAKDRLISQARSQAQPS
jgi:peptidoglycan/LPS O-acetylase OafA/YrhL